MPLVKVKGKTYFETADGRRFIPESKPFRKYVNAERKQGRRAFESLKFAGALWVPNPVTEGKGSAEPLVEIETNLKGEPTKRGIKLLKEINGLWNS